MNQNKNIKNNNSAAEHIVTPKIKTLLLKDIPEKKRHDDQVT